MRSLSLFVTVVLCVPVLAAAQPKETIVPAGTLLQCTLDEPRFSSVTAQVGDPILCHIDSLGMFGRSVFPRGAYLSGRFEDFRDPGHFFGKGWLKLEFATLALPGGTFPLSAKVVSVPHYRVTVDGSIRGRGHARRDAIEWSLPILWPEKLITLPMRGPRPTLKGETLIQLRVLEDVSIPTDATDVSRNANQRAGPNVNSGLSSRVSTSIPSAVFPRVRYGGVSIPAMEAEQPFGGAPVEAEKTIVGEKIEPIERSWRAPRPTFLIRKDGRGHLVTNYWFEAGELVYVTSDGTRQTMQPEELDFEMTARLNRERGLPFVIRLRTPEP